MIIVCDVCDKDSSISNNLYVINVPYFENTIKAHKKCSEEVLKFLYGVGCDWENFKIDGHLKRTILEFIKNGDITKNIIALRKVCKFCKKSASIKSPTFIYRDKRIKDVPYSYYHSHKECQDKNEDNASVEIIK